MKTANRCPHQDRGGHQTQFKIRCSLNPCRVAQDPVNRSPAPLLVQIPRICCSPRTRRVSTLLSECAAFDDFFLDISELCVLFEPILFPRYRFTYSGPILTTCMALSCSHTMLSLHH